MKMTANLLYRIVKGCLILLCTPVLAQTPMYLDAISHSVGDAPFAVALGDINGDNVLDLVTANASASSISVLLGGGAGDFAAQATRDYTVGNAPLNSPFFVALGDLNDDGKLDAITANASGSSISILLGDGVGGFGPPIMRDYAGVQPVAVALGDLNSDGALDAVTANASANSVSILLGDGAGDFTSPATRDYPVGGSPTSVALGDVNGDGKLDLATANSGGNISLLLGDGVGGFNTPATRDYVVGEYPYAITLGNVNSDSKLDLVTANYNADSISVLLGDGMGGFITPTTRDYAVGASPASVALGDVNGDDKVDLVTANYATDNISILLGDGEGVFSVPTIRDYIVGGGPEYVVQGDVNDDGKSDLITANSGNNTVSILLHTNVTPVAEDSRLTVDENSVGNGTLVVTDADNDALTFSIVTNPQHGKVTLVDAATGDYNYAPTTNYNGTDSFIFQASDGTDSSNAATVSITINAKAAGTGGGGSASWLLLTGLLGMGLLRCKHCRSL